MADDTTAMIEALSHESGSEPDAAHLALRLMLHNAESRASTLQAICDAQEVQIERLTEERDEAWASIHRSRERIAWLLGEREEWKP